MTCSNFHIPFSRCHSRNSKHSNHQWPVCTPACTIHNSDVWPHRLRRDVAPFCSLPRPSKEALNPRLILQQHGSQNTRMCLCTCDATLWQNRLQNLVRNCSWLIGHQDTSMGLAASSGTSRCALRYLTLSCMRCIGIWILIQLLEATRKLHLCQRILTQR